MTQELLAIRGADALRNETFLKISLELAENRASVCSLSTQCEALDALFKSSAAETNRLRELLRAERENRTADRRLASAIAKEHASMTQELQKIRCSATVRARNFLFGVPGIPMVARRISSILNASPKHLSS
jgi:hypothetical protein